MSVFETARDGISSLVTMPFELAGDAAGSLLGGVTDPLFDGLLKMGLLAIAAVLAIGVLL